MGTLGFGSAGQTERQRAIGNGLMEVTGNSPIGQPTSNQEEGQTRTVCRYIMAVLQQTVGMTNHVLRHFHSFAAGKFVKVQNIHILVIIR